MPRSPPLDKRIKIQTQRCGCESPSVRTRWAWWSSRSTVAVARVLGMIVSKPDGWRLLVTAMERRS